MTVRMRYRPRGSAAMTGAHQWEDNAAVQAGGRNHVWRERQNTRKFIQQRGEIIVMDTALAVVDYSAETQFQLDYSEPLYMKAYRMELRPNRRKGRNLSAQFKVKTPPLCTGGSGLLHTKCVSISVT